MVRYMEISMYLAAKHMARYMEISMYLAA